MYAEHAEQAAPAPALSVEHGMIGDYHIVYEQAPRNWAAYSPDAPGCMATGRTRSDVERTMREALALWAAEERS